MQIPTDIVSISWSDDQNLEKTNYFETDYCQLGLYYLCQYCGNWDLLAPTNAAEFIEVAAGSRGVIITRGLLEGKDTFQLRFVDDEEYPYMLMIEADFVGFPPERTTTDAIKGISFRIHKNKVGNTPIVMENVIYNEVETLPWVPRID
jgi:hypothetical protein